MNRQILYSISQYRPMLINNELINIGLAFHIPERNKIIFEPSTATKRILSFDNELTKKELTFKINYLKYEFTEDNFISKFPHLKDCLKDSNVAVLEELTKYHVNEIIFSKPVIYQLIDDETFEEAIAKIKNWHLYFDKPREKRMNKNQILAQVKRHIKKSYDKSHFQETVFNFQTPLDSKPFDYSFLAGNDVFYIKILKFDYTHLKSLANEVKNFIFDLKNYEKQNKKLENLIIVANFDYDDMSAGELNILNYIKKNELKVIGLEAFITALLNKEIEKSLIN